ncbi:MAG: iron-sulfur cluster assembly protein [Bacteroidota bacterium]
MITKNDIINAISGVQHPAIANTLINLGLVREVEFNNNLATVIFAFPFPNIPIAEQLIYSVYEPIKELGVDFDYSTDDMTEDEKAKFMQLEAEGWKGL